MDENFGRAYRLGPELVRAARISSVTASADHLAVATDDGMSHTLGVAVEGDAPVEGAWLVRWPDGTPQIMATFSGTAVEPPAPAVTQAPVVTEAPIEDAPHAEEVTHG